MARTPLPDVPHEPPTEEERRLGSTVRCSDCGKTWPLRLSDRRDRSFCVNCGRRKRREAKAAQRANTPRAESAPRPPLEPLRANGRVVDVGRRGFLDDLAAGRVPEDVARDLDALIEQAARRR
jgi:hypothetical protein